MQLILVIQDESILHMHNEHKLMWYHIDQKTIPEPKGPSVSLIVLDFLTLEWGCLQEDHNNSEYIPLTFCATD